MQGRNISDIIENYLKSILSDNNQIEIKRSQIADRFDVVPSQINYVIKTRFTTQEGYIVESKRGGGGYIRIEKVNLLDNTDFLDPHSCSMSPSINTVSPILLLPMHIIYCLFQILHSISVFFSSIPIINY